MSLDQPRELQVALKHGSEYHEAEARLTSLSTPSVMFRESIVFFSKLTVIRRPATPKCASWHCRYDLSARTKVSKPVTDQCPSSTADLFLSVFGNFGPTPLRTSDEHNLGYYVAPRLTLSTTDTSAKRCNSLLNTRISSSFRLSTKVACSSCKPLSSRSNACRRAALYENTQSMA